MKQIIIILLIVFYLVSCDENKYLISKIWIIEEFYINGTSSKNQLKIYPLLPKPKIVFQDQKTVTLPRLDSIYLSPPYYPNQWKFKRKGFDGQVIITDNNQKFFSGTYDIDIIEQTSPKLIRLYSDSIEFLLREEIGFSINRRVIPH